MDEKIEVQTNPAGGPTRARNKRVSSLLDYVEMLVLCIGVCFLTFAFLFRLCNVSGESMMSTLHDGQLLIISDLFYEPQCGDIVVFHQTSEQYTSFNEPIIKRVIGRPGDTVRIDYTDVTVSVNGEILREDYIQLTDYNGNDKGSYISFADHDVRQLTVNGETHIVMELTVPEGKLFVMGDNRNHSADSRSNMIGLVDERRVLGHVLFRLTPLSAFGKIQ